MPDIFGDETITPENEFEDITLETLVGESQKYKTPDELAKAYSHADRELVNRAARIAELEASEKVLKDLLEARNVKSGEEPPKPDGREHDNPDHQPAPKPEDISELVRKELSNASEEKRRADNINRAAEALNNRYGSAAKAQEAIRNRAAELGVGFEWLRDMAAASPDAFLASMGVTGDRSRQTPSFNNEVNRDSGKSGQKDFRYWENVRKTNPKAYYSAEVQKQLFAARRELGDKFFNP